MESRSFMFNVMEDNVYDVNVRGRRSEGVLRFNPDSDQVLAEMDRATVSYYASLEEFVGLYGSFVDRLGLPRGKYFWQLVPNRKPFSFEERALDVYSLHDPYYQYVIRELPSGFYVRTGINVPQFDLPGGARQVQFFAGDYVLTANECVQLGILEGWVNG